MCRSSVMDGDVGGAGLGASENKDPIKSIKGWKRNIID